MGGLRHAGRARRAGGALDAAGVEQHQQRVALAAREAEVGVAGQPVLVGAVDGRVGHLAQHPADQVVAQVADPGGVLVEVLDRHLDGGREAGDRGGVDGAAADVALLATAVHERGHVELTAYDESADAVGPADLVAGQGQGVHARCREVDRHRADRLHRVGVHRDAVGRGQRDDLVDRLQRAHLVVGPHHRDQGDARGIALDRGAQGGHVEPSVAVDRQQLQLGALGLDQPVERVEHGVVLDRADQDPAPLIVDGAPRPVDALEREVVGLCTARGEDHLARAAVEGLGDGLARLLDDPPGLPSRRVQRARVADVTQVRRHRLDSRRKHRRRRSVIEVDGHNFTSVRRVVSDPEPATPSWSGSHLTDVRPRRRPACGRCRRARSSRSRSPPSRR